MKILTLKNKLKVILYPSLTSRSVVFGYSVKAGSHTENGFPSGTAHFLEHMLFKGSENKTAKQINEDVANIGAIVNAFTSEDETKYYIQAQTKHWKDAASILSDFFWHSTLPKNEIKKEKQVIIEEFNMYIDMPSAVSGDNLGKILDRSPVLGTKKSVRSITRETLEAFYNAYYHTDDVVFVATGNFDPDQLISFLETLVVRHPRMSIPFAGRECKPKADIIKEKQNSEQAHICWSVPVSGTDSPDSAELEIIATILGANGNASSRLYDIIREEKGLAYALDVSYETFYDRGYLSGYVGLQEEHVAEVREIIKVQCRELEEGRISEDELKRAMACATGQLAIALDDVLTQNDSLGYSALYDLSFDIDAYFEKLEQVKIEDIKRVASKYQLSERIFTSLVLPKRRSLS